MLFLLLLILPLPLAQGTSPYVPGTPGAPWTDYELLTGVDYILFVLFHRSTVSLTSLSKNLKIFTNYLIYVEFIFLIEIVHLQ